MKSKIPLMLMEQMVMLLVFALAAALCLQAFVYSDELSQKSTDRDQAVTAAQSVAELIRGCGGDAEHALSDAAKMLGASYDKSPATAFELYYDKDWNLTETENYVYCLKATNINSENIKGLCKAEITVISTEEQETLFTIEIAWQREVSAYE